MAGTRAVFGRKMYLAVLSMSGNVDHMSDPHSGECWLRVRQVMDVSEDNFRPVSGKDGLV